jgi:hypothetical protein
LFDNHWGNDYLAVLRFSQNVMNGVVTEVDYIREYFFLVLDDEMNVIALHDDSRYTMNRIN